MSLHSVLWEEDESLVHFKCPLAPGTRREDVNVGIEDGKLLIISEVARSRPLSSSPPNISVEGDVSLNRYDGKTMSMKFNLPTCVNPNGYETSIDDAGVLTVTFKKLKPEKKKLMVSKSKLLGGLAEAFLLAGCKLLFNEMGGDDY